MKIMDSLACSCGFVNENEFHFLLVCPLYNRHTLKCYGAHSTITLRTLLYGYDNLDFTESKRITTETLRFINYSKRFA